MGLDKLRVQIRHGVPIQYLFRSDQASRPQNARWHTFCVPGFVKYTVPESQASTKKSSSDTYSIRICVAIHFLICSMAGAAALPTPGPTPDPPAKALAPSGAVSASENTLGRGI